MIEAETKQYIGPHTRRLAALLSMNDMGAVELKRTVEKVIPRELAYMDLEGKVVNARELLVSEGVQASGLIPTEVYATVIEGSEPAKCMRNVLPIYTMTKKVEVVPLGITGTYAPEIVEGTEITMNEERPTLLTFTAKKYGGRPMITREMVNDCTYDVIARNINKQGLRIENTLNQLALSAVLEASGTASDCGGSGATPLAFTAAAVGGVVNKGFQATDIIYHPTMYGAILSAFTSLSTNTGDAIVRTGKLGPMFGCNSWVCGVTDTSSTYVWGWGTDNYVGALVIDRNAAGGIGMREDIMIENYRDPVRDLVGMNVLARFDAQSAMANAAYRVIY